MKLDAKDQSLLGLLKNDSRASNVELAKAVGLTEGAVRWRIRKMQESGVIKRFSVEVSGEASAFAVLMIKAKDETKKMMADIVALGIHKDAYEISGEFDGCIILEGSSVEDIDRRIDQIRKVKEVAETRTFISFRRW
ncbi:MAG: Lrp/AsnC family transcriptional regulator [Candidatus Micrarchaeota archaeon]